MQVFAGHRSIRSLEPSAVALGIFDGVHRGHRLLLDRALDAAQRGGLEPLIYTFHPHPARLVSPANAPSLIEPIERRLEHLAAMGFRTALVEPFDDIFSRMSAADFIHTVLLGKLAARAIVVGENFRFGKGRTGSVEELARLTAQHGVELIAMPLFVLDGEPVTSTRVRQAVSRGDVALAAELLGRPFELEGLVMHGAHRGRTLGFPTANVASRNELWPARGVYATRVSCSLGTYDAVTNLGLAPTFDGSDLRLEAHLLDFPGQALYGLTLSVQFVAKLRDEQSFAGPEALKEQIARDIQTARDVFARAATP